ncbi:MULTISPECIES: TRAP transporter large permease subunit [Actinomycetes]|uniref:TRAP transporter large permease n=2 Tax=Actinomycetes TaxID=1760 RepID=A0ABP6LW80_9MICC
MEWYTFLLLFFAALIVVLLARVPVSFAMLGVGIAACLVVFGSVAQTGDLVGLSIISSVNSFTFSAIPLFILMGEMLFRSRIAQDALVEIAHILRKVPGRMPMVAVAGGGAFGVLSGSALANTALFGRTLLPRMRQEGYDPQLAAGAILASGGLAMILPPSAIAILWGGIAQVPIGPLLIAGIVPVALMAAGYACIVIVWSLRRTTAPHGAAEVRGAMGGGGTAVRLAMPGALVAMVLGLILFGVATPTESAALGAVLAGALSVSRGRLTAKDILSAARSTVMTSAAIFFLVMASSVYGQLMNYVGVTGRLVEWTAATINHGAVMLAAVLLIIILLGAMIDQASIMLVTAPLLMPIAAGYGWDPIWFSILVLISLQIGNTSPPFGMGLFILKGVAPEYTLPQLYRATLPWIGSDLLVIVLVALFPAVATYLPALAGLT